MLHLPRSPAGAGEPDQQARYSLIRRVLWFTLGLNLLVAFAKILTGFLAGNLTVTADGFHSVLDASNNVVGLIALSIAIKPADAGHPYGHRKYEHVAAMLIGALLMLVCYETFKGAFGRVREHLANGTETAAEPFNWLFPAVVLVSLGVNLFVATWEYRVGRRTQSTLLLADSKHTASDGLITLLSLTSLFAAGAFWWVDPLLAAIVGGFLLYAGWSILEDNLSTMTDRSRLDPEEVRHTAEEVDGVINAHAIRSHGMENDIHLDLHIVVGESLTAPEVTRIEEDVRGHLRQSYPQVTLVSLHHETEEPEEQEPLWKE